MDLWSDTFSTLIIDTCIILQSKAIKYNVQIFRNFYPKGVNMTISRILSERTNSKIAVHKKA
jgi:hypothetical protein